MSMWSDSFYPVFRKEFLHIFRDFNTLRLAITMPVLQLLLFGFIDQTVHDVATVVADQDRSAESRAFLQKMEASKTFKIVSMTQSAETVREQVRAGHARVGVVIPPKFRNRLLNDELAQVLVLIDGSDSTVSAQALASINGLVAQENLQRQAQMQVQNETITRTQGLAAQPIILFNPEGRTANFLIPGLVAILLYIVAVVLASTAIVREREKGTLEQLLVTPVSPLGLMLGKLGPYLIVGLIEMAIVLALMHFAFSVPIRGAVWMIFAVALVYIASLLALGLLISTRARTQTEAFQLAQMTLLPSIFLSGYIFPFEGLPIFLKAIGILLPVTHMIAIMRGVIMRNATLLEMWPHVFALAAASVILVGLASKSLQKVSA